MSTRKDDFEEFVVVCSDRLLRTAYLLTRDAALAEDLLDRALTKAWFGWGHLDDQPEPYVRRVVVNDYTTWWRRRWGRERSRRRRAVAVLRFFDELSVEDVADLLDCPEGTVRHLEKKVPPDEPARLHREAARLVSPLTPQDRARRVVQRLQSTGARRRGSIGAVLAVAAVAAVAAIVVVPGLLPKDPPQQLPLPDNQIVDAPPRLAGFPMPQKVKVRHVTYAYERGQEMSQSRFLLRVAVAPTAARQVFGWATSAGTQGNILVSVDGRVVTQGAGGRFEYGVALTPHQTHLLVIRVLRPQSGLKMALAIWGPNRF